MSRNFREMLEKKWDEGKFVCVGLDSEYGKIPKFLRTGDQAGVSVSIVMFNRAIVDATKDLVCAYKPNTAFYEAFGEDGLTALRQTMEHIRKVAPDVSVILDAKRGDIGNTNSGYTQMAFGDLLAADAITVHPYLGQEALQPFLDCKDKGIIVLCRTSNPGAGEFQDLNVSGLATFALGTVPLYKHVAYRVSRDWNKNGNCALVVGATYPEQLHEVREVVGDMPILIPAVGFQQKDVPLEKQVEQVVRNGKDSRGKGMIINSSRGLIFASSGPDFAEATRRETLKLHNLINQYR